MTLLVFSETGVNAQIMNGILNIKAAEKGLHFGTSKCKMMIIGKNKEQDLVFIVKLHFGLTLYQ